jgi:tRNA (mo5U34)-methyltransferase
MPWPDVRGKRCLEIGTYDGFLAFELERRGAAEVVATDIPDHTQWDWPLRFREQGPDVLATIAGPRKGVGFQTAHAALRSSVQYVQLNVYDLAPERVGRFDVVVCGSLMLHLRDPLRALAAIRSVCEGVFLSAEQVRIDLSLLSSRRALVELDALSPAMQWWIPGVAGHLRMLEGSGFTIQRRVRYSLPFGGAQAVSSLRPKLRRRTLTRLFGWGPGVPHHAVLAHAE